MRTFTLAVLVSTLALCSALSAQSSSPTRGEFPLFVKVQLDGSVKLSSLKVGETVEGNLTRDVYSSDNRVFAAGSHIQLTVSGVERKRKTANERWPWVARVFLPHHENSPLFDDAAISMPDGTKSAIKASLLSSNRVKVIRVPTFRDGGKDPEASASIEGSPAETGSQKDVSVSHRPLLYLEAHQTSIDPIENIGSAHSSLSASSVLPAGTVCRLLLLENISASKSHAGDEIHARLLEPVLSESKVVVPAGSMFEGRVMKATRPRAPSRAGSLTIAFESIQLPEGRRIPVSVSLASVAVNASSPVKIDREGRLQGSRPGVMWMLINGGAAAGIAKVADDGTQLIVEALISTATDASTAGTARLAASIVSAVFMLTRKGHDVVLPNHTEITITFNRALMLSAQIAKMPEVNPTGGTN
jgi:hypothetical protein